MVKTMSKQVWGMENFQVGDRVSFIKSGYGKDAGKRLDGTVVVASGGRGTLQRNYIHVKCDNGTKEFGFADLFRGLYHIAEVEIEEEK